MVTQMIVAPPAKVSIFIVMVVRPGGEQRTRELLSNAAATTRSVSFRYPLARLLCVLGIGAHAWDRLYDLPRPRGLHPFKEVVGAKHTAVSTPGDLLLHVRADSMDLAFELAQLIVGQLDGAADVVDEVHGFRYFDGRDLLGFVDGSENPEDRDAVDAVTIGDEDPAYAGGSYVIVQKYLHDLAAWRALSVEEQEAVIGRSKLDNVEMADEEKPTNSHVFLNTITDADGVEQKIVRDNLPFGRIQDGEFGTYFIGYSKDPGVTEHMLRNMFVGNPEGNYDRILDFSVAHTGSLYFVPSAEFLETGAAKN